MDAQKFGLPQRRRRLYILGAPRNGKVPVMKGNLLKKKKAKLSDFLSNRKKEKMPSSLIASYELEQVDLVASLTRSAQYIMNLNLSAC